MAKEPAGTIQAASRNGWRRRAHPSPRAALALRRTVPPSKAGAPSPVSEARNELPLFCIILVAARFPFAPPEGPRSLRGAAAS
jgi:hypothetical protein